MVDSVILPLSGRVILDANGDPVSGAKLEVFDAGTSNQQTVYSDSALSVAEDNPIEANSAGVVPVRYVGTTAYKVTFDDSADVALSNYTTWDNIKGAVDTSTFLTGSVTPSRSVINKTTTYTTVAGDVGKQISADATGGNFTISLLSAVTTGDGGDFVIKHDGTAGEVTVSATGGQTIDGQTSLILQAGDAATFRSDGANYTASEAYSFTDGIVTLSFVDPLTPSLVHASGTNYQLTVTADVTINAPTNVRAGTKGRITVIMDGTGGHAVTWNSVFKGNVAVNQSADAVTVIGFHARTTTAIDFWAETGRYFLVGVIEDQKADTVAGGTFTAGSWQIRDLTTLDLNTVGISLATNVFTLLPGEYYVTWSAPAFLTNIHQSRLFDVDGAASVKLGTSERSDGTIATGSRSTGFATLSISTATQYRIEHQCFTTSGTNGFGFPASLGGEIYSRVEIWAR